MAKYLYNKNMFNNLKSTFYSILPKTKTQINKKKQDLNLQEFADIINYSNEAQILINNLFS